MFDSLRKLLGIAGQIGGGVVENAQKGFHNAMTLDKPPAARDGVNRPIRPGAQPYYPGTGPNSTMPYQHNNEPIGYAHYIGKNGKRLPYTTQQMQDLHINGLGQRTSGFGAYNDNTPIPSMMGQQYAQNPYDPQFVGPHAIDPKVFGYGPDNLSQR